MDFIFPLRERPELSYHEGGREYGAWRPGPRLHAGCDLVADESTEILAMSDGVVIEGPYEFFSNTFALEVQHDCGYTVRYTEIQQQVPCGVRKGNRVSQGQVIGYIGLNEYGTSMLHLEIYSGQDSGLLTQGNRPLFYRRSDNIDPTQILDDSPLITDPAPSPDSDPTASRGTVSNRVRSALNLREEADVGSAVLASLSVGMRVRVLDELSGGDYTYNGETHSAWYKIKVGSNQGYAAAVYIDIDGTGPVSNGIHADQSVGRPDRSRVISALNLRARPQISSQVLASIPPTGQFTILGNERGEDYIEGQNNWFLVSFNNLNGYVAAYFVTVNALTRPRSSWERLLADVPTNGASDRTASQDNLSGGIYASEIMAETDLQRVKKIATALAAAAIKHGLPPALIAAVASRESQLGAVLEADGWAQDRQRFGILQVDRGSHTVLGDYSPTSKEHLEQGAGILAASIDNVRKAHPDWNEKYILKGGVAAYNSGVSTIQTIERMDVGTTGDDYSSDVIARAQYYLVHAELRVLNS